ncbi:hypothetical protein GCM10025734_17920 [Kitasatospora paranensis]
MLALVGAAAPVPAGAASPTVREGVSAGPARFVPGACPQTADPVPGRCGFLEVPENRERHGGRTIRLAVAIIPAASARPAAEPVVFMEGVPAATRSGASRS